MDPGFANVVLRCVPGRRKEAADIEDQCPSWIFWQYGCLGTFQLWTPGLGMQLSKLALAHFSPHGQDPACWIPISCHFSSQNYIYFLPNLCFSSPRCLFPVLVCLTLAVIAVNAFPCHLPAPCCGNGDGPKAPGDAPITWWMELLHVSDAGVKSKSTGVRKS